MYKLLRNILFWFDAEKVHYFSMDLLKFFCKSSLIKNFLRKIYTPAGSLPRNYFGLTFSLIRTRVNLPSYDAADLTLDIILNERRLELAFEGFALDDLKRLDGSVGNLEWNSPKLIFPIPKREMNVNANLQQNEGY